MGQICKNNFPILFSALVCTGCVTKTIIVEMYIQGELSYVIRKLSA